MSQAENGRRPLGEHETEVVRHFDELRDFYENVSEGGDIHLGLYDDAELRDGGPEAARKAARKAVLDATARRKFSLAARRRMTDAVTEPAMIGKGDHVLDAGCGLGATALYLAKKHGCKVTGVNISRRQLEVAGERAAAANLAGRIEFLYMDCSHPLTFENGSFDVVVNMESACYYSNRDLFLREVNRILRPGGRFVTEDFMTADDLSDENRRRYVDSFCRAWSLHSLESQASYTRKLKAVGLKLVEFAGFNGADEYGLHIAEDKHMATTKFLFGGVSLSELQPWHDMWGTCSQAWRPGHISLKRFLARKPQRFASGAALFR